MVLDPGPKIANIVFVATLDDEESRNGTIRLGLVDDDFIEGGDLCGTFSQFAPLGSIINRGSQMVG